jgi:hypothetical protein
MKGSKPKRENASKREPLGEIRVELETDERSTIELAEALGTLAADLWLDGALDVD